nr:MAG TPA: hypothetical protein [Caudoviricetes sp.]
MITRVYGKVDDVEVIFDYVGGNHWEVAVPFDRDGVYIVELYAENDQGDRTFYATALMIITADGTCTKLKMFPYQTKLLPDNFEIKLHDSIYKGCLIDNLFEVSLIPIYHIELVRCELCGRY